MKLSVDGAICHALVDSGCSHCIVHAPYCASWTRKRANVMTMSGERQRCEGVGRVQLRVSNGDSVVVDVYVVDFKPLGFEFILGVNGISALGGVTISPSLAIGHLPVCGWLRVATAYMKRKANALTSTWDEVIYDESLRAMLEDTVQRVERNDPGKGRWNVVGEEATVWVDASSLALSIVIEVDGNVVEDASCLRSEDSSSHINMAELDAVIKGVNAALAWKLKKLHVRTDSLAVYHWISNALSGKVRLKTKASSEMLIRRRVDTIKALVDGYGLILDIELVRSECNRADALTRVAQKWHGKLNGCDKPIVTVCGGAIESLSDETIAGIHEET